MWTFIRIAVSACVLAALFAAIDRQSFGEILAGVRPAPLISAGAVLLLFPVVAAFRWRMACGPTNSAYSYPFHLRAHWASSFMGQALPTSMGVEAMRIWFHSRKSGSIVKSTAGVMTDRVAGLMSLLALIVIFYPFQASVILTDTGRALGAAFAAASLAGLTLILLFASPIGGRLIAVAPFEPLRRIATDLQTSMTNWRTTTSLCGVSLVLHAISLTAILLIAKSIGVHVTFLDLAVLIPPSFLLLMIPVSIAGWGLRESGFVASLSLAGVSSETALAISIIFGLLTIAASLPGGLFFVMGRSEMPAPNPKS